MLREIHIGNFSKIITSYKPQLFNVLTVIESRAYNPSVECYSVVDQQQNHYQLYLTEKELEPVLKDIEFVEKSPKLLLIKTDRDHIILEEHIDENLYEMLLALENKAQPAPFLDEPLARAIVRGLKEGLENYSEHNIEYNAISPKNIVRRGGAWELSLAGLLLRNEKEAADYYKADVRREGSHAYALGTLLFKLLFGFVPLERRKQRVPFTFKEYLKYLDREETKKALKIYYFADRMLEVSEQAKNLIELSLKGDISLSTFYSHEYFDKFALPGPRKELSGANREIRMLSLFGAGQQSSVMAAIEHRRKYPQERINARLLFAHELSREEVVVHLQRHPVLCEVEFQEGFRQEKVKESLRPPVKQLPRINLEYFYREEEFDPETDFPCRDLLKIIGTIRGDWEEDEGVVARREAAIKLYGYPYAMVFELQRVVGEQSEEAVDRINKLSQLLLQVSQLHFTKLIQPLHRTELIVRSFQDLKLRFREAINWLYKHFLSEAIRKYNVKKDTMSAAERSRCKKQGLDYYKLCLKLMECSLLVRKQGKDLDLQRIQTSDRKEIESDLDQLLRQYFPNKIEIN